MGPSASADPGPSLDPSPDPYPCPDPDPGPNADTCNDVCNLHDYVHPEQPVHVHVCSHTVNVILEANSDSPIVHSCIFTGQVFGEKHLFLPQILVKSLKPNLG